ncbi:DeoR/GlpR family DNA-binding transcription regulator [Arthrobacter castelli]|uniref:DeoR/GlpR family DNA-binding transcription regulator n=1 Tax=Arthrobacter castelli TaxID=271431 RepID=UPI0003F7F3D9|nr:DeoR/GlpR family DNA-binding transcription regulator [Arthrobacter castelli]
MAADSRRRTRQRHDKLLALVRSGRNGVHELSAGLGVSPSTVRRDLARLNEAGEITRTYGGAAALGFVERELSERMHVEPSAKVAIGLAAAELVPEHGTIFIDAGSTCAEMAGHLGGRSGLTVLTRGLEIAVQLASDPQLEVVVIGGQVARKSHGTTGPLSEQSLNRYMVDVAFLGVDALDPHDGVGEPTLAEAQVKEAVAGRARRVVVLADATKLDRGAMPAWAPLPSGWSLITNAADPETLERYRSAGVDVTTIAGVGAGQ